MQKVIENEIRGNISDQDLARLAAKLMKEGKLIKEFNRFSIRYEPADFETSTEDVRIREQEDKSEIVMKIGAFDAADREEIAVEIVPGSFEEGVKFLAKQGYVFGYAFWRDTQVFNVDGIELALVKALNHSNYFELEITSSVEGQAKALAELREMADTLSLNCFENKEQYFNYLKDLDKHANIEFHYGETALEKLRDSKDNLWKHSA